MNSLLTSIKKPRLNPSVIYQAVCPFFLELYKRSKAISREYGCEKLASFISSLCVECVVEEESPYAYFFINLCIAHWVRAIHKEIKRRIGFDGSDLSTKEIIANPRYQELLPKFFGKEGADTHHFSDATNAEIEPKITDIYASVGNEIVRPGGLLSRGGSCCVAVDDNLVYVMPGLYSAFKQSLRHAVSTERLPEPVESPAVS